MRACHDSLLPVFGLDFGRVGQLRRGPKIRHTLVLLVPNTYVAGNLRHAHQITVKARGGRVSHFSGDLTDELPIEVRVQHALVTTIANHHASRLKTAVDEDFMSVRQLQGLARTAENCLKLALAAEDEDVALAVTIHDINVAIRSHIAIGELEAFADLVGRKFARWDGQQDFAFQIAFDDFLLTQHRGEKKLPVAVLANDKAMKRLGQWESLDELPVRSINLNARIGLLDAHVDLA